MWLAGCCCSLKSQVTFLVWALPELVKVKLPDLGESTPQSSFPGEEAVLGPEGKAQGACVHPSARPLSPWFPTLGVEQSGTGSKCLYILSDHLPAPVPLPGAKRTGGPSRRPWPGDVGVALMPSGAWGNEVLVRSPGLLPGTCQGRPGSAPWAFVQAPWVLRAPGGGRQQL